MDLRWSWNHKADELWRRLDPALWESTRHPNVVLQTVARDKLMAALADPDFCRLLDRLMQAKRQAEADARPGFSRNIPRPRCTASPISAWNSC